MRSSCEDATPLSVTCDRAFARENTRWLSEITHADTRRTKTPALCCHRMGASRDINRRAEAEEMMKRPRPQNREGFTLPKTHCFRPFFCHDARCPFQPPDWLSAPRSFVDPVRRQCVSWAFACWEYSASIEAMQCAGTRGSSARRSALGE